MSRRRVLLFGILCAVCLLAGVAVVARGEVRERRAQDEIEIASRAVANPAAITTGTIVFRNLDTQRPSWHGFTALAASNDPATRDIVSLPCARVYFAADHGLCLEPAGTVLEQKVTILDQRLQPAGSLTLKGVPTRARVSPDGHYGAVTFFVSGHSYAEPGSFSTQTTLIDLRSGKAIDGLEDFHVTHDGEELDSPDVNFWGVTFASDSDRFYATLATRGRRTSSKGRSPAGPHASSTRTSNAPRSRPTAPTLPTRNW